MQGHHYQMVLLDRVHDVDRLVTIISNRASHVEAYIEKLKFEGDLEQLTAACQRVVELQADNAKIILQAVDRVWMGATSDGSGVLEHRYRVALARFQARYPDLEVASDPFTEKPEDSLVPMETRQEFDNSVALTGLPRVTSCFTSPCIGQKFHGAMEHGHDRPQLVECRSINYGVVCRLEVDHHKVTINVLARGSTPTVIGSVVVPRWEMKSPVNPINVDVSGVKSLSVKPNFWKASKYLMSVGRTPCVNHYTLDPGICDAHFNHQGVVVV
ncbi:hypothetical protein BHE74_00040157 [Ensete ventricosum]|nr:hypothetical protein BHE74_00040157 [Ensete ventricosum]